MNKSELLPFIPNTAAKKNTILPTDIDMSESVILEQDEDDLK